MHYLIHRNNTLYAQAPAQELPSDTSAGSESQDRDMNDWFFVYNCDMGAGFVAVTIYPAGQSTVRITQNLGAKDEIGFYGEKIAAQDTERIRNAILQSTYQELPAATTLPPTTAMLTVGEGRAGEIPQLKSFALTDLPQPLRKLIAEMDHFIGVVRAHPIRVIQGKGKAASPQLEIGHPLKLEVSLTNIGTQPILLHNFLRAAEQSPVKLSLRKRLLKKNIEQAESVTVEVPSSSIEFISLSDQNEKPSAIRFELLADSELKLQIEQTAYLPPGEYDIALVFQFAAAGIAATKTIEGTLGIDCGKIEIPTAP
jgi:hypothetical protein